MEPEHRGCRREAGHGPGGPPQRRQVDAVQPADQVARRHRGRLRRPHARPALRQRASRASTNSSSSTPAASSPTAESGIYMEMAKQTRQAVAEADVVVFVLDARGGLSAQDHDIAKYLRKLGKPTRAGGQQGRGHDRRGAADRVLRARPGRGAPGFRGARAGHPQPGRAGVRAAEPSRGGRRGRRRRTPASSSWPWPAAPTSASRR